MTNHLRSAALLSVVTNVVIWLLIGVGLTTGGLEQALRLAVAPGRSLAVGGGDLFLGIGLMLVVNWLVWVAVWFGLLTLIRECRGAPAW